MGLRPDERVLVVTDLAEVAVGSALEEAAKKVTGQDKVQLFILEDLASRPLKDLPDKIASSIPSVDVTFWAAQSLPGELVVRQKFMELARKYVRHGHMPNVNKLVMEQGMCSDYNRVYDLTHKVHTTVKDAHTVEVTNSLGTNLRVGFDPNWRWVASDGRYHDKGRWGNLPEGETYTAPKMVSGKLVTNLLGDWFSDKYGSFSDSLSLQVEDSLIDLSSIQCKNTDLKNDLLRYLATDQNSIRASEFALPTNPELMSMATIGNLLQDEKARVHMAFGDPYQKDTGAPWKCPTHIDMLLEKCDVVADGFQLMKNGNYLI